MNILKAAMSHETLQEQSELLILPDGRVLAHNITPALAALLSELEPGNEKMRERREAGQGEADKPKMLAALAPLCDKMGQGGK